MNIKKAAGVATVALAGYDTLVRPWMLRWGASSGEQQMQLPGDEIASGMPAHYTRAVTIEAPPEAVWPWLAQIGDHRAGFYSYDWAERFVFPRTVHYIEGTHSATCIHPELQDVHMGGRINTGSVGKKFAIGNPVTVMERGHALVVGTWAFVLQPMPGATALAHRAELARRAALRPGPTASSRLPAGPPIRSAGTGRS